MYEIILSCSCIHMHTRITVGRTHSADNVIRLINSTAERGLPMYTE